MLRAIRAEKSVGSASASSSALVCSDWVWPCVAAIASMQVRIDVVEDVLRGERPARRSGSGCAADERLRVLRVELLAPARAHSSRAARSLATSMKKFIPIAQKKLTAAARTRRSSSPAADPARRYSTPSASV